MTDAAATIIGIIAGLAFIAFATILVLGVVRIEKLIALCRLDGKRPTCSVEITPENSPMSIHQAAFTIAMKLRENWDTLPSKIEYLNTLMTAMDPRTRCDDWLIPFSDEEWPEDLEEPPELNDRILWKLQCFIGAGIETQFSQPQSLKEFDQLIGALNELGVYFPDADKIEFDRVC